MNWELLSGELVRLGSIDQEKDAEIESGWTHEVDYMRVVMPKAPRPLSKSQMQKRYEYLENRMNERGDVLFFAIRTKAENRLLGFVQLDWLSWSNANGELRMGICAQERNRGFGTEALTLALDYAFSEINLHRVQVWMPAYNQGGLRFFERAGFKEEVRRREAAVNSGERWDELALGLLQAEWAARRQAA